MFTINLPAVAAAAIIAAGLVAATDFAQSRAEPAAALVVADRFPTPAEMMIALDEASPAAAHGAIAPSAACVREHWPYLADECLTAPNGGKVAPPTRTITIERQIAGQITGKAARLVHVASTAGVVSR